MSEDAAAMATEIPRIGEIPDAERPATRRHVLAVLSALMGFASISTDLYLPAMPEMGRDLSANVGSVELTVSGFLIGFSLGQLVWGPLGDRYGRRLPVAAGLLLFVLGSAGCGMSSTVDWMIFWRIVQALGACCGVVLARAMVRDLYEGPRAAQMLSTLMTIMAIAPLLGPIVGGQILALAGWRAIFGVLVAVGLATLAALFTIPETLPIDHRSKDSIVASLIGYGRLLANRRLMALALSGGFFYAGIYAYIAGTPFAYITYYHVPPAFYGLLFAIGIVGIMTANMANAHLVTKLGSKRLLRLGALVGAMSGIFLLVTTLTEWGGLWGLVVPLFLFVSCAGLIVANSIGMALRNFPRQAGAVSALVGAVHYGCGIVGSFVVGALADGTPRAMACVILVAGLGSFLSVVVVPGGRED